MTAKTSLTKVVACVKLAITKLTSIVIPFLGVASCCGLEERRSFFLRSSCPAGEGTAPTREDSHDGMVVVVCRTKQGPTTMNQDNRSKRSSFFLSARNYDDDRRLAYVDVHSWSLESAVKRASLPQNLTRLAFPVTQQR
jgi:hypothetical protein